MAHLLIVAGTTHQKSAHALREELIARGYSATVVTAKTASDTLRAQVALQPTVIWLANPQTTKHRAYLRLYKAIQKQNITIIPVRLNDSVDVPVVAGQITTQISTPQTGNRRLLAGITGLLVVLLLMGAVFGLVISNQPEDALPTLIALDIANTQTPTLATQVDASDTMTATDAPTHTTVAGTTPDAEMTPDLIQAEETADIEPSYTPTATLTPSPTIAVEALIAQEVLLVDFDVDTPRGYAPLTVNVRNASSGAIQSFQWDYETDGVMDSIAIQPPTITYREAGIYTLTLTIIDERNRKLQSQKTIEVYGDSGSNQSSGSASASFLTSTSSGTAPLKVQFTNRTIGSNLDFRWDFDGNGTIDFEGVSPPAYTYSQVGTYTPRLEVISANGTRNTTQAQINVYTASPDDELEQIYDTDSKADFTVSPSIGTSPLRTTISNASVGTNNRYEWDFDGDDVVDSASANPPTHRYATPGTYTVTLTVKGFDRYGGAKISRAQAEVVVTSSTSAPTATPATVADITELYADFVASTYKGTAPLTVQYYNYSSGENPTYQWDFDGDGTIDSSDYDPVFTFTSAGTFATTLYVTDASGTDSTSIIFNVSSSAVTATLTPSPIVITAHTQTPSRTPSITVTGQLMTNTPTPVTVTQRSVTNTASPTLTLSHTPTLTLTHTPTVTLTLTPTITPSLTPTPTRTLTLTPTLTPTPIPSNTPTATPTATSEPTD